jgi:hypothetical protein
MYADPRVERLEVVFDDRRHATGMKSFLQAKRAEAVGGAAQEPVTNLSRDSAVPHTATGWGKLLASAKYKRQLINILREELPSLVAPLLREGQTLVVAGGFDSGRYENKACVLLCVGGQLIERVGEEFKSNHAEADYRICLHVLKCPCKVVTVFSPDSDVLMVGLLTFEKWSALGAGAGQEKQIYVQISRSRGEEANQPGIVDVNKLVGVLRRHPDLQTIDERRRVLCIVSLFVFTGCDFVSFFSGVSKKTFLKNFYHEAHFISGATGHGLADWDGPWVLSAAGVKEGVKQAEETGQWCLAVPQELRGAFGSFLRNTGVGYFLRYRARFEQETAPRSFTTITGGGDMRDLTGVSAWVDALRNQTWTASAGEEGNIPSLGALFFHFMRGVLVLRIWDSACTGWMSIPDIESFGYKRNERTGALELVYDFEVQIKRIEAQVELVLKGCGCKTCCESRRCKCQKVGERCSVACRCVGCKNVPVQAARAEHGAAAVGQPVHSADPHEQVVGSLPRRGMSLLEMTTGRLQGQVCQEYVSQPALSSVCDLQGALTL